MKRWRRRLFKSSARRQEILPEDIFIDSSNLPNFNVHQFEGRLEKPISRRTYYGFLIFAFLVGGLFATKLWVLQVTKGEAYEIQSERNLLSQSVIFADRGVVEDRSGTLLAWNVPPTQPGGISTRQYISTPGFSELLGYVTYPAKDNNGFYYQTGTVGRAGLEKSLNNVLQGQNGQQIVETDALGSIVSQSVVEPPQHGEDLKLSIDAGLQEQMYLQINTLMKEKGFTGGGGVLMDVNTGELLSLVSAPEYDSNVMTEAVDAKKIASYINDPGHPFLNRPVAGLYTPGSIMKPYIALGALMNNIITPEKKILSTGTLRLPNPFVPGTYSIFKDWQPQGWVDMKQALARSSDIYFYEIGGGFESQKGLGIEKIGQITSLFGFGSKTGINLPGEESGLVPSPAWKKTATGDDWLVGDTYHAAIGQSGFQITPLQAVRAVAALANSGNLITPTLILGAQGDKTRLNLPSDDLQVVRNGMHLATEAGNTAQALNLSYVQLAAKTGTAELGVSKNRVNSWIIGYFPFDHPKYAFAIVMESGPVSNLVGSIYVARQLFDWMHVNRPQYFVSGQ